MDEKLKQILVERIELGKYYIVGLGEEDIPFIISEEYKPTKTIHLDGYFIFVIDEDEAICGPNSEFPDEFVVMLNGPDVSEEMECHYSMGYDSVLIDFDDLELDTGGPVV